MKGVWYCKGEALLRQIRETRLPENQAAFWYIGQMGMVLKWKELILYVDPVLNDLVDETGNSRRNYEIPFLPQQAAPADWVLCSHAHADHMNPSTLIPMAKANPGLHIAVPAPERAGLEAAGVPEAQTVGACAEKAILLGEDAWVCPVESAHESYAYDEKGNSKFLGYLIHLGPFCFYHSGDTLATERLAKRLKEESRIDAAFLPINGADIQRHRRNIIGNMDCRDAAWLAEEAGAALVIPLHYDMIMGNEENPLIFAEYMRTCHPGRRYHIMQLGERFLVS